MISSDVVFSNFRGRGGGAKRDKVWKVFNDWLRLSATLLAGRTNCLMNRNVF